LYAKYPNAESIKEQFGPDRDVVTWEEKTEPSPHDESLELKFSSMSHPGISISTMGYTFEGEDRFMILSVNVEEAGFVDFLGIDKGSSREDVIKAFGEPDSIEDNCLIYQDDESGYISFGFEIDDDGKVWRMRFENETD
jgi:hypothetical protein